MGSQNNKPDSIHNTPDTKDKPSRQAQKITGHKRGPSFQAFDYKLNG
jgi:hypothetical protein